MQVVVSFSYCLHHPLNECPYFSSRRPHRNVSPDGGTQREGDKYNRAERTSRRSSSAASVHSRVSSVQWSAYPWAPFLWAGSQLSASWVNPTRTAGFLGFGRIAQSTLARLLPFGFTHALYVGNPSSQPNPARDAEILAKYAPHGLAEFRRVDLAELARESDVVFVLAPGGPSTYHVVNEEFLKGMKKTAVLVNTSRGALVNSDALAKACREGWIWGACIDVVEGEPNIPADHPLVKEPRSVK